MWEIILWILLVVVLIVVGAVAVFKWVYRKGRKGYTKIKDKRDERKR